MDISQIIRSLHTEAKNLKVLVVEDDRTTQRLLEDLLSKFFDEIEIAQDGEEGLKKFEQGDIDIVLTDIKLPKMDGLEMIRRIRQKDREIPVIVISGYSDTKFLLEAIRLGVDGYLLKPIQIQQFLEIFHKVLTTLHYKQEAKRYKHLLQQYKEAVDEGAIVSITDPKGFIKYVNKNFEKISKYSKDELIGKYHNIVRHPDVPKEFFQKLWETILAKKTFKGLIKNRDKEGKAYYVQTIIKPILDEKGEIQEFISIRQDVTDLMNPKKLLLEALKNGDNKVLVMMKLEHYSLLEEFYPQEILEKLEQRAYRYLSATFHQYFLFSEIFQLGDGEFALIIPKTLPGQEIVTSLQNIQQKIKQDKITIDEKIQYDISVLMSVVYEGEYYYESAKLGLKKLEKEQKEFIVANNLAKEHQQKAKQNIEMIEQIKHALDHDGILVYYQPIVHNQGCEVVKYEALVRMRTKDGRILTPFFFLEAAKLSNLYPRITQKVLDKTIELLRHTDKSVSINLSSLDIENDEIRSHIIHILKFECPCVDRITFELLEDEEIRDFEVVRNFITLVKSMGVSIAIDDFGSGYSNYARLVDYQPDILKIDGSLVKDIHKNSLNRSVIKSIVTFAKEQGMQTVAEFVENEDIIKVLRELEVDFFQGYFCGRPGPIDF